MNGTRVPAHEEVIKRRGTTYYGQHTSMYRIIRGRHDTTLTASLTQVMPVRNSRFTTRCMVRLHRTSKFVSTRRYMPMSAPYHTTYKPSSASDLVEAEEAQYQASTQSFPTINICEQK